MDTTWYIECNRQLYTDNKFYRCLDENITANYKNVSYFTSTECIRTNSNDNTSPQFMKSHVKPGQFYILPKVHKSGNPQRPIVSSDSHPMECLSHFVGYHLQPLINKLPSFLKDANDFLHKLLTIGNLPTNSLVVTLVDSSLYIYTNIPHKEGNNGCEHSLCTSSNKTIPTSTLCDLIPMILTMNNFSSEDNTIFKSTPPPWVLKWLPLMLIFFWVFSKPMIWKMPHFNLTLG